MQDSWLTSVQILKPTLGTAQHVCQALHFPWAEVDWSLTLDRSDGREGSEKVDSSFRGLTLRLAQRGAHLAWIYFASWSKEDLQTVNNQQFNAFVYSGRVYVNNC